MGAAVLLDNDGVLVDSGASIRRAFRRWGAAYGLDGDGVYEDLGGQRSIDIATRLLGSASGSAGAKLMDTLELEDADSVHAMPGAGSFLRQLGSSWTLVTSGPRAVALARLRAAGLPVPGILVAAEDIGHGKPDPECYLTAARLNGVSPECCVAFEDSAFGVRAAVSAGCQTIRVGETDLPGQVARIAGLSQARATRVGATIKVSFGVSA